MTKPDEVGWRVRTGAGLVIHAPMSRTTVTIRLPIRIG